MSATPAAVTVSLLTRMLREAFDGPPGPWTYFTDTSPGTGAFGTIGGLSRSEERRVGKECRTAKATYNEVTDAASGVVDVYNGIDKGFANNWNKFMQVCKGDV